MAIKLGISAVSRKITRELNSSQAALSSNFQKLSTGLRINKAADDVAGLAVATGLRLNTKVYGQAIRNVNDGISKFQIADGALDQTQQVLYRMSELASMAANGSLSSSQRVSLDKEYVQLDREIRRLIGSTSFNGEQVLAGSARKTINQRVVATGSTTGTQGYAVTGEGRYVTMHDSATNTIKQTDTLTGIVTTVATGVTGAGRIEADSSGNTVVFVSTGDLTGSNGSGQQQVFRWDRESGAVTQVTNTQVGAIVLDIALSGDGSQLAINTNMDYVDGGTIWGDGGAVGFVGIYAVNMETNVLRAVHENTPVFHGYMSWSSDGKYLAYTSQINTGGNNADNTMEVHLADLTGSSVSVTQITNTSGNETLRPLVNTNGEVFWVSGENLVNQNSLGYQQIYKYSKSSGVTTQITNNTSTSGTSTFLGLTLSADGSTLSVAASSKALYSSTADSAKYESYRIDTSSFAIETLTDASAQQALQGLSVIGYSSDGSRMYAISSSGIVEFQVGGGSTSTSISTGTGAAGAIVGAIGALNGTLQGLGGYTLTSRKSAKGALDAMRRNIELLGTVRADVGSAMARFESAGRLLAVNKDQQSGALSRIMDVDVASESASLIRNQIKSQAATALLAQANLQAKIVLQLLS